MKKKNQMRETRVVARAVVPLANGEAAQCGDAVQALNVRECEEALQVTGAPVAVGAIAAGDRLLTVSGGKMVTCSNGMVKVDGQAVVTVTSEIVGAHTIGDLLVIVCRDGLNWLSCQGGVWTLLDPADAVPQLTFTVSTATMTADISAYTFDEPYNVWRAPLADADTSALAGMLRTAYRTLNDDARAQGRHTAPILVRWAVRMWDGTYLWVSDPVRVGDVTLANADRIAADVTVSSNSFTGTEATVLPLIHYSLNIGVTRSIPAEWLPLVAGVDVLATDEAQLLNASRSLDYRCLTRTTGGREYVLEMGLSRRSADAISTQLAASPWHLIATAPASSLMSAEEFVPPVTSLTLSSSQCAALATPLAVSDVVCSTTAGGRLYCCTGSGDIVMSGVGNALIEACRRRVVGAVPLAMAVVTRPLYSSGFGRYPVYVFSDDGIYAIPQSAAGMLGEARLVDRTVIAGAVAPVEAGGDVWLLSRHGHLCCLNGSRLEVRLRHVDCTAMAWCNAYRELWLLPSAGHPVVVMASGRTSERSVGASQLYSDPRHALAVTSAGVVLDLEQEETLVQPVSWRSHPIALHPLLGKALHRVVWHVRSEDVNLTLKVTGQRGIMAQDSDMSVISVTGAVDQPLATPMVAARARTVRLSATGTASTGTLFLPTLLYHP
jgi:hypothetical protein